MVELRPAALKLRLQQLPFLQDAVAGQLQLLQLVLETVGLSGADARLQPSLAVPCPDVSHTWFWTLSTFSWARLSWTFRASCSEPQTVEVKAMSCALTVKDVSSHLLFTQTKVAGESGDSRDMMSSDRLLRGPLTCLSADAPAWPAAPRCCGSEWPARPSEC